MSMNRLAILIHKCSSDFPHTFSAIQREKLVRDAAHQNFPAEEIPIHDLFGAPMLDWSAEEPRWRYIVRLSENPWIKEHVVTGLHVPWCRVHGDGN